MNFKERLLNLSRNIFVVLVILIPVNLGKHFITTDSYVHGILVDYLIPTIYLQDILIILVLVLWFLSGSLKKIFKGRYRVLDRKEIQFAILFVFSTFLSVLSSQRFLPSIYFWARLPLYFLLLLYILSEIKVESYFFKILDILAVSTALLGILGISQYLNHGAVFNNYLVFGEQPYSASTLDVAKKTFMGKRVVPAYGVFRHPNIFGGYLSLVLVWIFSFLKRNKKYLIAFVLGTIALFFTFSFSAWAVFTLGIALQTLFSKNAKNVKHKKKVVSVCVVIVCTVLAVLPLFKKFSGVGILENPSFYRRSDLLDASFKMARDYPLFGVGLNNFTVFVDDYMLKSRDIRFTQPVHNIFLLIFAEAGIFSLTLFLLFLNEVLKKLLNSSYFHVLLISFLQIVILGSLDHYLFTIHQTQILFWLVLGMALQ